MPAVRFGVRALQFLTWPHLGDQFESECCDPRFHLIEDTPYST